jgi:hypothetical protein
VVAPTSEISRLDWLTNAVDDARADAASLASETAEAAPTENVEATVGDSDPVKAIEDALRTFCADEILVVTRPTTKLAGWKRAQARLRKLASLFQSAASSSQMTERSRPKVPNGRTFAHPLPVFANSGR